MLMTKTKQRKLKNPPTHLDSAWKDVFNAYFPEFIQFFWPDLANKINWEAPYEMLDKELQALTKGDGSGRRYLDALVQLFLRKSKHKVFFHIEVEGKGKPTFNERLFEYYCRIYGGLRQPIITLVVLADDDPHWRPEKYEVIVEGVEVLSFKFLTIKLLDYEQQTTMLKTTANPLGVIVLATLAAIRTKQDAQARYESKVEITRLLYDHQLKEEDVLLQYRFIDWLLALPKSLAIRYNEFILQLEQEHAVRYITTAERLGIEKGKKEGILLGMQQGKQEGIQEGIQEGMEKGIVEGRHQGELLLLLQLLEYKFGKVSELYRKRLTEADTKTLLKLGKRVLKASRIEEVFDN
jgi:flagellar biosynthesis/type III secretory pathway protein FliH